MFNLLQTVVSEQTLVPIGIALAVLAPVCGWLIWLNGRLQKIDGRLASIESSHLETWSYAQMRTWCLQLKEANPTLGLSVPKPDPPTRGESRGYNVA